jgi:hypothetical protein
MALQEAARAKTSGQMRALSTLARAIQVLGGPGMGAPEAQDDLAEARAAIPGLLWQPVRGSSMSLLEVLASPQLTARVLAHGGADLYSEGVTVNASQRLAAVYRHPAAWAAPCVAQADLGIFHCQRVWPLEARPVHEAAIGLVEAELQRVHRAFSSEPRALMMAGSQCWHSNASHALPAEHKQLARLLLDVVVQWPGTCTLEHLEAQYADSVGQMVATAAFAPEHVQAALSSFLSRAPALHAAPRVPVGTRGAPAWAPQLAKDSELYMAIRNAVPVHAHPMLQPHAPSLQPCAPIYTCNPMHPARATHS